MSDSIPVYGVLIEEDDVAATAEALRRGWLGMGRDVSEFEHAVESAVGPTDRRAVAVSTGGAALHVAMLVAGVTPGTEVILPSLTHLADAQAVLAAGGEPVFCDVDDATLCLDAERAAELVTPRTGAILAQDYGGHLCDHDAINALAEEHGLRVVHDAAHSFGSAAGGRPIGSFSDICMFSFDPVKALTCIDAGVLMLHDGVDVDRARAFRLLGSDQPAEVMYQNSRTWDYEAVRVGFRYHLSNVHAAIGLTQLAKLDRIRSNRQASCRRYVEQLKGIDPVRVPECDWDEVNPFLIYIRVPADDRDRLRAVLGDKHIGTGIHWRPAHQHAVFRGARRGPLPVTEQAAAELVTLPLHSAMANDDVDAVCDAVAAYFR